jgi:predicted small secreted protein
MKRTVLFLVVLTFLASTLSSCGGGGGVGARVRSAATGLEITTRQLRGGDVGQAYSGHLSATGGAQPYAWSIVLGQLPPGLSLNAATGAIVGTPKQAGTFSFTAEVKDSSLFQQETALQSLSMAIAPPPLLITTTSLPTAALGQTYTLQLQASGGVPPYTWSIIDGALPSYLTLDSPTGLISGTPTEMGTFSFTVQVTDSSQPQNSARLMITADPVPIVVAEPQPGKTVEDLRACKGIEINTCLCTSRGECS